MCTAGPIHYIWSPVTYRVLIRTYNGPENPISPDVNKHLVLTIDSMYNIYIYIYVFHDSPRNSGKVKKTALPAFYVVTYLGPTRG